MKADTGAEATVIPYHLYKEITKAPLRKIHQPLKGWLATKPIHPKGCVRLPTVYKNRKVDLLYLVVEGDFTPLLSCDACLDLEVLKFMNLQLITSSKENPVAPRDGQGPVIPETPRQDVQCRPEYFCNWCCFEGVPGLLQSHTWQASQCCTPGNCPTSDTPSTKTSSCSIGTSTRKDQEMEEDGIIVKEEGHTPWVSSMLIIDG